MLTVLATVMSVAAPLKIWNSTRIEMNLERHQQLLLKARMDALSSQINPHFLFNTLNTVSSLIRFDPDMARGVVLKLSNILRRLLRKHETFVPLKEELNFIDDYLDIEVARFGRDNLEFIREIAEEALEAFVPSMLLQPIVENCLKHGLASKLEGGRIRLRSTNHDGRLNIEIEDNGLGMSWQEIAEKFLFIGRNKREEGQRTPSGRLVIALRRGLSARTQSACCGRTASSTTAACRRWTSLTKSNRVGRTRGWWNWRSIGR